MNDALRKLFRKGAPSHEDIDAFVAANKFPLVDDSDITFVYRGGADEVFLRCWISGLNTAQPLQALQGSDLWALTIELPPGSRIEYKLDVVSHGEHQLILDPLNEVLAHDPFGANYVCQGAGYQRPSCLASWQTASRSVRKLIRFQPRIAALRLASSFRISMLN